MDKARYRVIKLSFQILVSILGLVVGGGGLILMYQINTNVSTASEAISNADSTAISDAASKAVSNAIADFKNILTTNAKLEAKQSINIGPGNAMISGEFKSEIQACWYYQATYETLHPYTVLWEMPREEDSYPKIRVIAEHGIWDAHTCIRERKNLNEGESNENGVVVKLIGDEYVTHKIEAQFNENDEYEHIATSKSKYNSALLFDGKGRIIHRRIKKGVYKCTLPDKSSVEIDCKASSADENNSLKYTNEVTIEWIKEEPAADYAEAINYYLKRRNELHENLTKKGCGAVPIEPEFTITNEDEEYLENPSVIFLCHKNNDKSHVRIMVRQKPDHIQEIKRTKYK